MTKISAGRYSGFRRNTGRTTSFASPRPNDGLGADTLLGSLGADTITLHGGLGDDTITGAALIFGGDANDIIR